MLKYKRKGICNRWYHPCNYAYGLWILQDGTRFTFSEGDANAIGNITWNLDATEATFNFTGMSGGATPFYGTVTPVPVVITDVNGNLLSTDSVIATGGF